MSAGRPRSPRRRRSSASSCVWPASRAPRRDGIEEAGWRGDARRRERPGPQPVVSACRPGRSVRGAYGHGGGHQQDGAVGVLIRGSVGGRVRADPAPSFEDAPVVDPEEEEEGGATTVRPAGGEVLPEGAGDGRRGGLTADAGPGGELRHPWEHRARRGDVRRMRGRPHPHEPVDAPCRRTTSRSSISPPTARARAPPLSRRRASPPREPGAAARSTRSRRPGALCSRTRPGVDGVD